MGKIKLGIPLEEPAKTITELPPKEREELWSLLATLEEAPDRGALAALEESEEDVTYGVRGSLPMELGDALALVDAHLADLFNLNAPTQPVTALETLRTEFRKEVETFPSMPTQEAFAKIVQLKEQLIELAPQTPGYERPSLAFKELHAEITSGLQTARDTIISLMARPAEKTPIGFK